MTSSAREAEVTTRGHARQGHLRFLVLVVAFHAQHLLNRHTLQWITDGIAVLHRLLWRGVWVSAAALVVGGVLVALTPVPATAFALRDPEDLIGLFLFAVLVGELAAWVGRR